MCLTCEYKVQTREEKALLFDGSREKTYIHTPDNRVIKLTDAQIDEIIERALYVLCTGVDMSCDIWAIQWATDYKPKMLNFSLTSEDKKIIRYAEEAMNEELTIDMENEAPYHNVFRPQWEAFLKKIGVRPVRKPI